MPVTEHLVEVAAYVDDLQAAEKFYGQVLELPVLIKEPARHVFFQVGQSMLLVFLAQQTLEGQFLPQHGATGPGHFALGIPTESYGQWELHLAEHGVEIERRVDWPRGGKSLYFRDPAGNSVELVTRGLWGLSSGW